MTPQPLDRDLNADLNADSNVGSPGEERERNWIPLGVAVVLVVAVIAAGLLLTGRGKPAAGGAPDAYSANLAVTDLKMLESTNLAGGRMTYLDGHIANHGGSTVTGVTVEVVFRNYANEVAQKQTVAVTPIGMREPYVDTVPMAKAPLPPGGERDFRLIFDQVSPDWAGSMPELRVVATETK